MIHVKFMAGVRREGRGVVTVSIIGLMRGPQARRVVPKKVRRRAGRLLAGGVALVALVGASGAGAPAHASIVPSPSPVTLASVLPSPWAPGPNAPTAERPVKPGASVSTIGATSPLEQRLDEAAHAVSVLGLSGSPAVRGAYAGVSLTADRSGLDLWLTAAAPALTQAAAAFVSPDLMHVHPAQRSYEVLDALTTRVAGDVPALEAAGVYVTNAGPNEDRNVVLIGVRDLTPAKAATVHARYGDAAAAVAGTGAGAVSRQADSEPWWGGDVIGNDRAEGLCTLGPSFIKSDGSRYSMTAGHCFSQGSNLTNNYVYLGTVTGRYPYDGQVDAEIMPVDAQNFDYRTDTTAAMQSGARNASRNSLVCKSGIRTNEVCDLQVTALNQMVRDEYGTFLHQDLANKNDLATGPGDSGGPVYTANSDGTITIAGMTANAILPYSYCDRCSKQVSFTEYTYLAAGFGVSIL